MSEQQQIRKRRRARTQEELLDQLNEQRERATSDRLKRLMGSVAATIEEIVEAIDEGGDEQPKLPM